MIFSPNFPAPDKCITTLLAADPRFFNKTTAIDLIAGPYLNKPEKLANLISVLVKDGYTINTVVQSATSNTAFTAKHVQELLPYLSKKLTGKEMSRLPMLSNIKQFNNQE